MARRVLPSLVVLLLSASALGASEPAGPFELRDGDRVVLLGGGFVEQDRHYGWLETRLTRLRPDADVRFRNLGWGGDTVRGAARTGGYQNPDGLARLLKETKDLRPTVLLLGYGMNESFAGPVGLPAFLKDYEDLLTKLSSLSARTVLLSPTVHEDLGRPYRDPAEHNASLERYTEALRQLAAKRGLTFVDLFRPLKDAPVSDGERLTTNGILLTETGYARVARELERQLGLGLPMWHVELDAAGKVLGRMGAEVTDLVGGDGLRFRVRDAVLSAPGDPRVLLVRGLPAGEYVLRADGEEAAFGSAADWERGIRLPAGRDLEKLRTLVVRKNQLFYRRWRPFNDHSRHWGFIGGDFALYDKEIAAEEEAIARVRRPHPVQYTLTRKEGGK